ncbi:MAG: hypothetical protein M9920_14010 [Verrucomicrobiae bacterium]|nr:hypothetical protein [Verrucomicrobiae bacterium]
MNSVSQGTKGSDGSLQPFGNPLYPNGGIELATVTNARPKFRVWTGVVIFLLAAIFFTWSSPWRVLECGPDEGMEFSKIQLLLQKPEMAKLAWNDQSWFYSKFFAAIFSFTGFQPGIARLTTLALVGWMLFVFPRLMPKSAGWPHLLCACLFFWCWPFIPNLSVSAMLETPAFALAIIAAAITPREWSEWKLWRFASAGFLFAIAVQIKLTALIILPALAGKIFLLWWREIRGQAVVVTETKRPQVEHWALRLAFGGLVFGIVFMVLAAWSPTWNLSQLLGSHFAAGETKAAAEYRLEPGELLKSPGLWLAAILSIIGFWRKRDVHEATFALILLITVTVIHFNHRPWWYYYGIHFAVPLAILGGWGVTELLRAALKPSSSAAGPMQSVFNKEISMTLGMAIVSLWASFDLPHGFEHTAQIRNEEKTNDNNAIYELEKYKGRVKWVFTRRNILAAQAGYVLPPELTILAKKRYWTGNINDESILATVKHYQCEILILYADQELKDTNWNQFLDSNYMKVLSEENESIFVANRLNPVLPPQRENLLKRMGL